MIHLDFRDVPSPSDVEETLDAMIAPLLQWYDPDEEHVRLMLHRQVDAAIERNRVEPHV